MEAFFLIILILIVIYAYDYDSLGVTRWLFMKDQLAISSLGEPELLRGRIDRIVKRNFNNKGNLDQKTVFVSFHGSHKVPYGFSLTDNYVLLGTTRLTYFCKLDIDNIKKISYRSKFVHKISIKIAQNGENVQYDMIVYWATKKTKRKLQSFVSIIQDRIMKMSELKNRQ